MPPPAPVARHSAVTPVPPAPKGSASAKQASKPAPKTTPGDLALSHTSIGCLPDLRSCLPDLRQHHRMPMQLPHTIQPHPLATSARPGPPPKTQECSGLPTLEARPLVDPYGVATHELVVLCPTLLRSLFLGLFVLLGEELRETRERQFAVLDLRTLLLG